MAAHASEGVVLLAKKLGGLFAVILGCLLIAAGLEFASTSTIVAGVVFLALGIILLTLKIMRRNQSRPLG